MKVPKRHGNQYFSIYKILIISIFTFIINPPLSTASFIEPIQLTLQLIENGKPLTNQEVRIFKGLRYTDPINGEIVFELPQDIPFFTLEVPEKTITWPKNGLIPVPRDPSQIITVLIGTVNEQKTFNEITKRLEVLSDNVDNIRDYLSQSKYLIEEYLEQNNIELEQYKIQQILKFQEEKEFMREGQLKTIPLLTRVMNQYISCTKDLCDLLDDSANRFFNDTGENLSKLNIKISAYNKAYEELNMEKDAIITYLENYWGQGNLTFETRQLLNVALQNIHQLEMLISNGLIKDINDFNEKNKGKREKSEIVRDISDTSKKVRIMVENLDKDKERIIQKMKEYYPPNDIVSISN